MLLYTKNLHYWENKIEYPCANSTPRGPLAHLVERLFCKEEVRSSSLLGSTSYKKVAFINNKIQVYMNNNIENRFNRVPSLEEKKQLDLVTEEVLALYLKNQEGTKLHSLRTDHEVHLELLKQKKDERLTKNMRDLIKLLAMDF